jgi:hypothetical protein
MIIAPKLLTTTCIPSNNEEDDDGQIDRVVLSYAARTRRSKSRSTLLLPLIFFEVEAIS